MPKIKKQKNEPSVTGIFLIITVVILTVGVFSFFIFEPPQFSEPTLVPTLTPTVIPTPTPDGYAFPLPPTRRELNSGLTVSVEQTAPYKFVLIVLNHTAEDMLFPNQEYNLQIFSGDTATRAWRPVTLTVSFNDLEDVLPANSRTPSSDNALVLNPTDFPSQDYNRLRFYVTGTGQSSGKDYGAYADVILKP